MLNKTSRSLRFYTYSASLISSIQLIIYIIPISFVIFKMLPHALSSERKSYKKETGIIISWMIEKAQELGYPVNFHATSNNGDMKDKLATRNYVPLATCMAGYPRASFVVPLRIVGALKKAIKLRHKVTNKLIERRRDRQATVEERHSDETHRHFTNILKKVQRILTPRFEARIQPPAGSSKQNRLANASKKRDVGNNMTEVQNRSAINPK